LVITVGAALVTSATARLAALPEGRFAAVGAACGAVEMDRSESGVKVSDVPGAGITVVSVVVPFGAVGVGSVVVMNVVLESMEREGFLALTDVGRTGAEAGASGVDVVDDVVDVSLEVVEVDVDEGVETTLEVGVDVIVG
jgi:hypothetical protein